MGVKHLLTKPSQRTSKEDEELREIVERSKTRIKVVGCGGAGNNTVTRLMQVGIVGAETIAINTDAMDLLYTDADRKILIGREVTQGLGAGADPELGRQAAEENKNEIKAALKGANMVFLTAGLGGGCLRGSSLIYTNPHGPVRIDSVKEGDYVYSVDEDGRLVKRRVLLSVKTGRKKVYEIKTNNRTVYASFDHPFLKVVKLKEDTKGFYQFTFRWIEAKNLKPSDLVVVAKNFGKCKSSEYLYGYKGPTDSEFFRFFGFNKIKSVKEVGEEDVYDVIVDGSHNFIAEGFVVHNTGTGSIPVVAKIARRLGALTLAIVTLPFKMEGRQRMLNAEKGLQDLEGEVDTLIVVPNEKLLEIVPDVSLEAAFRVADEILVNSVKGTTELVTKPGLVNLDFADVKAVMKNGGLAMIGLGESDTENRAVEAVQKAINNPLIEVDISNAKGALVNVIGGPDLTMREFYQVVDVVSSQLSRDAKIISGAQIDRSLGDKLRTLLIVTGVESPYIFGGEKTWTKKKRKDIEKLLGVEFVE